MCGRIDEQRVAFAQQFPDQIELAVLEIAQAAMDHARGRGAAAGAEIVPFDKKHPQPLQCQLAEDADAVDSAADDDDVERAVAANQVEVLRLSVRAWRLLVHRPRDGDVLGCFG